MAESLIDASTVRFFDKHGLPPCDIAIFVKERPDEPYRQAVEQGSHIVYMPVDYYRARTQLDADAPFLASCSALLVHSRRLGALLAEHNSAIRYVDHPNLHGLVEKAPYRPAGFLLWVGDFLNLPYLLRWCELTGRSRDLRILTNARRTSLRGAAMTMSLARRLGVELDVRRDRVNGIPMTEWDPGTQRALMRSAKASLDVKGGTEDFAQHTKPPTKAQQFIVSGIPFAANAEASAVEELLEDGFEIADVDDPERWFSREYWNATREYSVRLEERIRPTAVAASYRRCVEDLAGRPPTPVRCAVRPRPPGPPFVDGRSVRAHLEAGRALRAAGASWKDTAPSLVQQARAAFRDYTPGFAKCALRDRRAARPPVKVSVLVDLTPEPGADPVCAPPDGFPDTWEIVASRSLRISDRARVRTKSIVRWPARGTLRDRMLASALADGCYLAFVPRLDTDRLAWIAEATAALERRPNVGLIRREETEDGRLDPAATLVVRRDVWIALQGYNRGPSVGSPRCGDLDLLQRVRQLGFRDDLVPGEQVERIETRRRRPRAQGGIVVFTAITNGYDRLLPLERRRVEPARRVAFLDESSRALARDPEHDWEIRDIDWHDEDPNRLAKRPKIRPELFFPDVEYSLWVDGNVGLTYPFGIRRLIELYLQDADMCVFRHHARSCIYEEAEACKVRRLDSPELIDGQMARYREEGFPARFGLQELAVILRRHSEAVEDFDRRWWEEISRGSRRDQLSFQYVRWKTGLPIAEFPLEIQAPNGLFVKAAHVRRRPFRPLGARNPRAGLRRLEGLYLGSNGASR